MVETHHQFFASLKTLEHIIQGRKKLVMRLPILMNWFYLFPRLL